MTEKIINVADDRDFRYEVEIKHTPHHGFSTAYYNGTIVAQREYNKMHQPLSDNDADWEMYQERLDEWTDAAESDLTGMCKGYFNKRHG